MRSYPLTPVDGDTEFRLREEYTGPLLARSVRSPRGSEIAAAVPISRPAVSHHLRLLREDRLVTERSGTRRIYRLHGDGAQAVRGYLEQVWGLAAARFTLLTENTPPR